MNPHRVAALALLGTLTIPSSALAGPVVADCAPDTVVAAAHGPRRGLLERARRFHNLAPDYQQARCMNFETGAVGPHDGGGCPAPPWWRTDCSGFVSATWDLETSVDTAILGHGGTLHHRTWVAKGWDALEPGDAINEPHGHAAIFTGWLDADHRSFCVMEEVHVAYTDPWGGLGCIADAHVTATYEALGFTPIGLAGVDADDDGGAHDAAVGAIIADPSPPVDLTAPPRAAAGTPQGCALGSRTDGSGSGSWLVFACVVAGAVARRRAMRGHVLALLALLPLDATACSDADAPPAASPERDATTRTSAGDSSLHATDARRDSGRDSSHAPPPARDGAVVTRDAAPGADGTTSPSDAGRDARDASDAGGVATLATGQRGPWGLAVDDSSVYWTDLWSGDVMKVALDGSGGAMRLATGPHEACGVAVTSDYVYWTSSTSVRRVHLRGGPVEALATVQHEPTGIAIDGNRVYWTDYTSDRVMRVALDGGDATPIKGGEALDPWGIAVDDARVYWVSGAGDVLSVGLDGGTPTTIAAQQAQPTGLALLDGHVYWTNYTGGTVMGARLDGSAMTTLASGQRRPSAIAADREAVYWTTASTVVKVARDGGAAVTLAAGQAAPKGMAVDGTHVYWASSGDGTIRKAAK